MEMRSNIHSEPIFFLFLSTERIHLITLTDGVQFLILESIVDEVHRLIENYGKKIICMHKWKKLICFSYEKKILIIVFPFDGNKKLKKKHVSSQNSVLKR